MKATYTTRLAPAPTGALHLGNARTFLVTWLRCRAAGGRLLMRMEDLDHPKVKPQSAREAYEDLHWLGLDWDEGPRDSLSVLRPEMTRRSGVHAYDAFVQSQRTALYHDALQTLHDQARLFPCFCTRQDILNAQSAPHAGEEMRYPGTCRPPGKPRASSAPRAWRFRIDDAQTTAFEDRFSGPQTSQLATWSGDFVVARIRAPQAGSDADGGSDVKAQHPGPHATQASYQLAVVVDDHLMHVTEVVRGDDLLPSTHRQLVLYQALEWTPPAFLHVPLVVGPDGRRLAKRHGDTRLGAIRAAGTPPERVLGWLAHTCGWAEWGEALSLPAVLDRFSLDTLPKEPVIVDARAKELLGVP